MSVEGSAHGSRVADADRSSSVDAEATALRRLYQRERAARKEAEDILERKSRELYELNETLERRVLERTSQLDATNSSLQAEAKTRQAAQAQLWDSEERFRSVVNNVFEGIITFTGAGVVELANPAAERLFGHAPGKLVGAQISDLIRDSTSGAEAPFIRSYLDQAPRDATPAGVRSHGSTRNVVGVRRQGQKFDLEVAIGVDRSGGSTRLVATLRDRTAQRRQQAELVQVLEQAEAANRAKGDFLAHMSHELRTPLGAMLGYVDLLEAETTDVPNAKTYLRRVRANGDHLLSLINDLLDLAKIESGKVELRPEQCNLADLIAEVVDLMHGAAEEKGLRLRSVFLTELPSTVTLDPLRYRQILINLVGNAIKFTDTGSVEVGVVVEPVRQGQGRIRVTVTDTGRGIPAAELASVFEPFVQGEGDDGTGLGLGISSELARLMDGSLTAAAEPDVGTVITFQLIAPYQFAASPKRGSPPVQRVGEDQAEQPSLSGRRVLLVEDSPDNQIILRGLLNKRGMSVTHAENGEVGVRLVREAMNEGAGFDVILMDMMMPVMDGYQATAQLRRDGITTPIIALTALAMGDDAKKCLAAGCDQYVTKPVRPGTLYASIAGQLGIPL